MATEKDDLARQIGADNADAIEALIDAKLKANGTALDELRREVVELRQKASGMDELKERVEAAVKALRGEIREHNDQIDERNAGREVTPQQVNQQEGRIEEKKAEVAGIREDVEARLRSLEAIVAREHDGQRPPSRLDTIEERLAGVSSHAEGARTVAAQALAVARASGGGGQVLRRALSVALAVWLIVFALYLLIFGLGPGDWRWRDAFGWPSVLAGMAALTASLVFFRQGQHEDEAEAQAEAHAEASVATPPARQTAGRQERPTRQEARKDTSVQGGGTSPAVIEAQR